MESEYLARREAARDAINWQITLAENGDDRAAINGTLRRLYTARREVEHEIARLRA